MPYFPTTNHFESRDQPKLTPEEGSREEMKRMGGEEEGPFLIWGTPYMRANVDTGSRECENEAKMMRAYSFAVPDESSKEFKSKYLDASLLLQSESVITDQGISVCQETSTCSCACNGSGGQETGYCGCLYEFASPFEPEPIDLSDQKVIHHDEFLLKDRMLASSRPDLGRYNDDVDNECRLVQQSCADPGPGICSVASLPCSIQPFNRQRCQSVVEPSARFPACLRTPFDFHVNGPSSNHLTRRSGSSLSVQKVSAPP
eukprot:CAMPEP_0196826026 /NCGR_PEP_ID=MMETSP1362-20130617/93400_1 /TAXON_ID=163516 /ORGANISM="Leptocylindrus danicus, Strain CCMP1856" /LENGTH=258 /DNA_ID=CAMNT_0042206557 /DNA_START=601 /DNA_END=1377 /DNA_ORIENTATION=+